MPIDADIIRREAARAANLLDGSMGRPLMRAAWRALPQDLEVQQDDLPAVLEWWAAELPDGHLTDAQVALHEEPIGLISRAVSVAGVGDPLGDALKAVRANEHDLAVWIEDQKAAHRNGELTAAQIERLESIPGWTWD